jgi:hypothetical protein
MLMTSNKVGIVVPTLGTRISFLTDALSSLRQSGDCFVGIVAPDPDSIRQFVDPSLFDDIYLDPSKGLAAAINFGMSLLPLDISYVSWLGDDDLHTKGSLRECSEFLDQNPEVVLVYGMCEYINSLGSVLFMNRSGVFAKWLMHVGPQLIPQPGSLFRRAAFDQVGGLDSRYDWAFDLDLLFKLKQIGKFGYLRKQLGSFRWHPGSLSVGGRGNSVTEASKIRVKFLPFWLKPISPVWEAPLRKGILLAGNSVSRRSRRHDLLK